MLQQLIRYRLRPPGSKLIMTNILLSSRLATAFTRLFTARSKRVFTAVSAAIWMEGLAIASSVRETTNLAALETIIL